MPEEYREGEDSGGGEKSSNVRGTESMEKRVGIKADEQGVAKFTKMFKGLSSELEKTNKSMKNLVKTARDLKNIWDKTDAPDMPGGGGGGTGKTDAGGVPSNGNFLKRGAQYGLSRAGFSPTMAGGAAFLGAAAVRGTQAAWNYGGKRIEEEAGYALTADRTGLLMRQMYGGTVLDYQSRWRQPLTGGLIGRKGVEDMMHLQTTMGINPTSMLKGVEGIRVASGFGYSTEQATQMISALAQPGSANMMTMMLGMGLYKPGGEARDPMDVVRNVVQRMGLDKEGVAEAALQPGSMVRANLARTGLPDDMQNLVLQYAQEQVQFRERGGRGMYDPASERHRQLMGIDDSYAVEEQRTRMTEVERSEKFFRRQVDNFADLERNTQGLIEKFQMLDEVLSGITGLKGSMQNKWYLRLLSRATGGVVNLGDTEHLRDAGMNSGFAAQLARMKNAATADGVPLTLSSGTRDEATQERLFRERHHVDAGGDISWNGENWKLNEGASPAAPPGRSLHGLGYAADLGPESSYEWIMANAAQFGLRHGGGFGEPWHVAPADITSWTQVSSETSRDTKTKSSGSGPAYGRHPQKIVASASTALPAVDVHLTEGMSQRKALETWQQHGQSRTNMPEMTGDSEGYGSSVITISPTINLTGSTNTAADADMLAKRVINLVETSEAIRALRSS